MTSKTIMNAIKIFVDEDREEFRFYYSETIKKNSSFLLIGMASNGDNAVIEIERLKPAVLITDINHPGMDGFEIIKYLHAKLPQIKIIVLSAQINRNTDTIKCYNLGADAVLIKPFRGEYLLETIIFVYNGICYYKLIRSPGEIKNA